jgi:hypothetical protein
VPQGVVGLAHKPTGEEGFLSFLKFLYGRIPTFFKQLIEELP